jgi:AbrB family looped-hinge helix DNA binding protein
MQLSPLYQDYEMSKAFSTVVTRKGQITIPAEVRQTLGLTEGDRVAIVLEDNLQVLLTRTQSVVACTAGMLKSASAPLSAEELRQAAESAIADAAGERSQA